MKHVIIPGAQACQLPFYLAAEEYLAERDREDYFFMWQVSPTVIIGRNQCLATEVNLDYCRSNGVNIVRRKSGGGCVYADRGNVMFSHITTTATVASTFSGYTRRVAAFLSSLGLDASAGGRNDVLIDSRKVSGNAFYNKRGRAIVHGTMLYDTDLEAMLRAITPSAAKLSAKGVESVRSRVTNIREHIDIPLDEFLSRAAAYMCDDSLTLSPDEITRIEELSRPYYTDAWLYGHSREAGITRRGRVEGAGEFTLSIELRGEIISSMEIGGDYFLLSDLDSSILSRLEGVKYTREAITEALAPVCVPDVIAGLSNESLINLII